MLRDGKALAQVGVPGVSSDDDPRRVLDELAAIRALIARRSAAAALPAQAQRLFPPPLQLQSLSAAEEREVLRELAEHHGTGTIGVRLTGLDQVHGMSRAEQKEVLRELVKHGDYESPRDEESPREGRSRRAPRRSRRKRRRRLRERRSPPPPIEHRDSSHLHHTRRRSSCCRVIACRGCVCLSVALAIAAATFAIACVIAAQSFPQTSLLVATPATARAIVAGLRDVEERASALWRAAASDSIVAAGPGSGDSTLVQLQLQPSMGSSPPSPSPPRSLPPQRVNWLLPATTTAATASESRRTANNITAALGSSSSSSSNASDYPDKLLERLPEGRHTFTALLPPPTPPLPPPTPHHARAAATRHHDALHSAQAALTQASSAARRWSLSSEQRDWLLRGATTRHARDVIADEAEVRTVSEEDAMKLHASYTRQAASYLSGGGARFYIYELPPQLNVALAQCWFDEFEVEVWDDERKEVAQNTADVWLHALLLGHSGRLTNAEVAAGAKPDLYFIPFYSYLSMGGHHNLFMKGKTCAGTNHAARLALLDATLEEHPFYTTETVEAHVAIHSFWDGTKSWGEVGKQLATGGAFLLAYERLFASRVARVRSPSSAVGEEEGFEYVPIPYVPNVEIFVRRPVMPQHWARAVDADAGDAIHYHSCFFRGNLPKNQRARRRITGWFAQHGLCDIEDSSELYVVKTGHRATTAAHGAAVAYAEQMVASTFCLIPPGDTTTSRRLFDAIAAGCIPLIVSRGIRSELPFEHIVDWDSFTVLVKESDVYYNEEALLFSLHALFSNATRTAQLQDALFTARDRFTYAIGDAMTSDYAPGSLVHSILRELTARLQQRKAQRGSFESPVAVVNPGMLSG